MPRLTAIRKQALDEMMKEALFEATVAILSDQGVDGLTMDRVASAAGIAKGSIYRYFRSKRDLLEFVYTKIIDPVFSQFDEIANQDRPALEKLTLQLNALLDHVAQHGRLHKLLFEDDTAHGLLHSTERRNLEAGRRQLAGVMEQGMAEGVLRQNDPVLLASMYLGLCKGVLESDPKVEETSQRENIHHLILSTFLTGAATAEESRRRSTETKSNGESET